MKRKYKTIYNNTVFMLTQQQYKNRKQIDWQNGTDCITCGNYLSGINCLNCVDFLAGHVCETGVDLASCSGCSFEKF